MSSQEFSGIIEEKIISVDISKTEMRVGEN